MFISALVNCFTLLGLVTESGEATRLWELSLGKSLVRSRLPFLPLPSAKAKSHFGQLLETVWAYMFV